MLHPQPGSESRFVACKKLTRVRKCFWLRGGFSIVLVEGKKTSCWRVSHRADVCGCTLDKHGWRSSDTAELLFEDCRVPASNLLGQEGRGFYTIMQNFQNERIVIGAMAMGEAEAAIEITL